MTRPEKMSKRKAFNKAIRARAAQEQTSFASVLQRTQDVQQTRPYRSMLNLPTHPTRPGRRNGMWTEADLRNTTNNSLYDGEYPSSNTGCLAPEAKPIVIDLMAIARPAKVKGIAKDFEVVKPINVIVLEDRDIDMDVSDDEWEEVYHVNEQRRTYSEALMGR